MAPFSRNELRFETSAGLNVSRPTDQLEPGQYPILTNLRAYIDGVLVSRRGLTKVGAGAVVTSSTPVHSIRRINNKLSDSWMHIVGTGAKVAVNLESAGTPGTSYTAQITAGMSGDPLSIVQWRPDVSPYPWAYIGDSSAYSARTPAGASKIAQDPSNLSTAVRVHSIGMPPPAAPPSMVASAPLIKVVNYCEASTDWTASGTAASLADFTRVDPATAKIGYAPLYDVGTSGWCSISPAVWGDNLIEGMLIKIAGVEYVKIDSVHPGSSTGGIVISSIAYDSGVTGACSIVANTSVMEIEEDALVQLAGGGGELVRVLSVSVSADDRTSFRCVTTTQKFATDAITVLPSFRCYTTATRLVNDTLGAGAVTFTLPHAGVEGVTSTGAIRDSVTVDLSTLDTSTAVSDSDIVHVGIRADYAEKIVEGKIKFDVDLGDPSDTSFWFKKNYYFKAFKPEELVAIDRGTRTVHGGRHNIVFDYAEAGLMMEQNSLEAVVISPKGIDPVMDDPGGGGGEGRGERPGDGSGSGGGGGGGGGGSIDPTTPPKKPGRGRPIRRKVFPDAGSVAAGALQWTELTFTVKELKKGRVGTDRGRNLSHVRGVQLEIQHVGPAAGTLAVGIDDIYITGGGALDSGPDEIPYYYRYRGRCSVTGARSNYSPPTREGIVVRRQNVAVTLAQHPTVECDKLDVERLGGTSEVWHYVGTVDNSASPVFTDNNADDVVVFNTSEGNVNYQPWPVLSTPVSGTLSAVAGTTVTSAAAFSTAWAPGTTMRINGIAYTIYRVHSTSMLELWENAGSGAGVGWIVQKPLLLGQALPYMWGPFQGFVFACGDSYNPGALYFSNGNNPDATQPGHRLEITPPSEPLMNGCSYNGRCYVWSSDRMFEIIPSFNPEGADFFTANEIPNSTGLFANWAFDVGPEIYFLGRDQIYASRGGESVPITDPGLRPLFSFEGAAATTVSGIPTVSSATKSHFRVCWYNGYLYFDYSNSAGTPGSLVCETQPRKWFYDSYSPAGVSIRIACRYGEEGENVNRLLIGGANTTTGSLYSMLGTTDDGSAINWQVRSAGVDFGDPRSNKLLGDVIVDVDPGSDTVNATVGYNHHVSTAATSTISGAGRQIKIIDISTGSGVEMRNVSLNLACASTTPQYLYLWEPALIERPETTYLRGTDTTDQDSFTRKYVRGIRIEADTGGVARTVTVIGDGAVKQTITVNHNGRREDEYGFTPFDCWELQLLPTDASTWKLYKWGFIFDEYPDIATTPTPWEDMGDLRAKWVQGVLLNADTGGTAAQIQIQSDGEVVEKTYTVTHSGQIVKAYPLTGQLWTPFITHKIRIVPVDPIGIFKDTRFIWEPEPELVTEWTTQATTHNLPGFQHVREMQIALLSSANVSLTLTIDGVAKTPLTIASTGGVHKKIRLQVPAYKGKLWKYSLTSTAGFRLYQKDCEVMVKAWGSGEMYQIVNPFGDFSREHGALI